MKVIVRNSQNKNINEYKNIVYRTRGLIINSNNEILLGKMDQTYQFPGGHANENESIEDCLIREIREETGINIEGKVLKPFYIIKNYEENLANNSYSEFNYFIINTDEKYDINNTNYDDYEIDLNYRLEYVNLDNLVEKLMNEANMNSINQLVYPDMIDVLNEYLKNRE